MCSVRRRLACWQNRAIIMLADVDLLIYFYQWIGIDKESIQTHDKSLCLL